MALPPVRRADFSQSLVHLTRERIVAISGAQGQTTFNTTSAFDVLKEILAAGTIRASGNEGYVKGTQKAVCLTEAPLAAVGEFASRPEDKLNKYRFYGVALSKKAAFSAGARPVIYLPDAEGGWIPADQKWRQVRFEYGIVDFTHEREWRLLGDLDLTKLPGLYVLVWSAAEAREVYEMKSPIQKLIRGVLPMEHLTQML